MQLPTTAPTTTPTTANDWLILLQDHPERTDLAQAHQMWLAAAPDHRAAWDETLRMWQLLGQTMPKYPELLSAAMDAVPAAACDTEKTAIPVRKGGQGSFACTPAACTSARNSRHHHRGRWVRRMAVAACLLLVLLCGQQLPYWTSDYATRNGETRSITLADGSHVDLAPETRLDVDFHGKKRVIKLRQGAAFFDVMPDKTAPFQVVTNSVAITVLGTAFNVDATTDGVDVAVQHGRVQVAQRHNQKILAHLSAGQALIVPSAGAPQARQINPTDVALWRTGQFVVADAPLPRVLAQLQRYYVGWIMLPNKDLQQKRLTGIFNLHNPEAALEAIAKTYGAKVRKITPWVRVLEPNSAP